MVRVVFAFLLACAVLLQSVPAHAMSCVAYVRAVTGFDLSGNAWEWWRAASGIYNRGHVPEPGAVMVFARTRYMRDGHVAIVREVLGTREILIDQANWEIVHRHRGAVSKAVHVIDASPNNDWTEVRVQWQRSDSFGRVNPVSGFVYPDADSHANQSQARYLEARMRSSRPFDTIDGAVSDDGSDITTGRRYHSHEPRCAVLVGHGHRLPSLEMASWHVEALDRTIGAARPR